MKYRNFRITWSVAGAWSRVDICGGREQASRATVKGLWSNENPLFDS
jgi:hypothetical protein